MEIKLIFSLLAALISACTLAYYLFQTIKERIKPHAYTWFIWGLTAITAFIGQWQGDGGYALLFTGWLVFACTGVGIISFLKYKSVINKTDIIYLVICIFAIAAIPFTKTALSSLILVCLADYIATIPTIRKSWNEPDQESAASFTLFTLTNTLAILALKNYSLLTILYPATIIASSLSVVFVIIFRRYMYKP